jgi:hypothetical protein
MNWLSHIFRRRKLYGDLAEEMRLHLEERTEQLMNEGMSRKEAEQTARRAFGNATLLEERSREVWQMPWLESLGTDLKLVFRRLGKSPGFAATVLLTLAIGIGANTAVFSVLNSVLFKPLPYPEAEQLVAVRLIAPGAAGLADFSSGLRLSPSMYFTFAEQNRTFQALGVWLAGTANVTGLAQPHEVHTASITDGVLQTLRVPPLLGRWLLPAEQNPHGPKAVMLSYDYWQRRFGGDPSVIGRNIEVDSQPRQIVGVMPQGFRMVNADFDLLAPLGFDRNKQILAGFGFQGVARLKPGVPITQANADVTRMLPIWMDSWSNGPGIDSHFYERWKITPALRPLKDEVIGSVGSVLWLVMGTIGVVMLIACTICCWYERMPASRSLPCEPQWARDEAASRGSCCSKVCALGSWAGCSEWGSRMRVCGFCWRSVRRICPAWGKSPWMFDHSGSPLPSRYLQACYSVPFLRYGMHGRAQRWDFAAAVERRAWAGNANALAICWLWPRWQWPWYCW